MLIHNKAEYIHLILNASLYFLNMLFFKGFLSVTSFSYYLKNKVFIPSCDSNPGSFYPFLGAALLHSLWDLSSPTWGQTWAARSGSIESQPLDGLSESQQLFFFNKEEKNGGKEIPIAPLSKVSYNDTSVLSVIHIFFFQTNT